MSQPFLAEIRVFGFNFAPRNWALCQGQLLMISQNPALFSLLGTTYGGNGQTTFALPDLGGRAPLHFGQGPGEPSYALGQTGGEENHTLTTFEMPAHSHTATGSTATADAASPAGDQSPARSVGEAGGFDRRAGWGPAGPGQNSVR